MSHWRYPRNQYGFTFILNIVFIVISCGGLSDGRIDSISGVIMLTSVVHVSPDSLRTSMDGLPLFNGLELWPFVDAWEVGTSEVPRRWRLYNLWNPARSVVIAWVDSYDHVFVSSSAYFNMTFLTEFWSWMSPAYIKTAETPTVGQKSPAVEKLSIPAHDGNPTIVTFLRHCGCPCMSIWYWYLAFCPQMRPKSNNKYSRREDLLESSINCPVTS